MSTRKQPQPWYRPNRGVWYLTLDGRQINLGPDEETAFQQYFEIMAARSKKPEAVVIPEQVSLPRCQLGGIRLRWIFTPTGKKAVATGNVSGGRA